MIGVRYQPDSSSEPVVELVQDEEQQQALVTFMILDLGRADAEPVTLVAQPETSKRAKIRRDIAEAIVGRYADDQDDDRAFDTATRIAPGLDATDGTGFFTLLKDAAEAHHNWDGLKGACLSEFEPELRDWDLLDKRFRTLLDEALDDLMRHLDACVAVRVAGDDTETKREVA